MSTAHKLISGAVLRILPGAEKCAEKSHETIEPGELDVHETVTQTRACIAAHQPTSGGVARDKALGSRSQRRRTDHV
jgi:hypothetical protein